MSPSEKELIGYWLDIVPGSILQILICLHVMFLQILTSFNNCQLEELVHLPPPKKSKPQKCVPDGKNGKRRRKKDANYI